MSLGRSSNAPRCDSRWITAFLKVRQEAQGRLPPERFGGGSSWFVWRGSMVMRFSGHGLWVAMLESRESRAYRSLRIDVLAGDELRFASGLRNSKYIDYSVGWVERF